MVGKYGLNGNGVLNWVWGEFWKFDKCYINDLFIIFLNKKID